MKLEIRQVYENGKIMYKPYFIKYFLGIPLNTWGVCNEANRNQFIAYENMGRTYSSDLFETEEEAVRVTKEFLLWRIEVAKEKQKEKEIIKSLTTRVIEIPELDIDELWK